MILYCVRHAQSQYNAEGRIQGQRDIPLSAHGRRQSEALAAALAQRAIDAIFASPLRRALETAGPLAERLDLEIHRDKRLQEIHAGIFEGLTFEEFAREHPDAAARWQAQEPDFRVPGGESRRDLMVRGHAALESIRASGFRQVVIISHGGLLGAALKSLLGMPAERRGFRFYNAAISEAVWHEQFQLLTLNDRSHLAQLDGPSDPAVE